MNNLNGIQNTPQARAALSEQARQQLALHGALDGPVNSSAGSATSIKPSIPKEKLDCSRCEGRLELGIFFDGTGNNRDNDLPKRSQANVARLYAAYPSELVAGFGRVYIAEGCTSLGGRQAIGVGHRALGCAA